METKPYHRDASIFFLLAAFFTVGAILLFLYFILSGEKRITSYQECVQAKSSKILESYPSICVTTGGKRFVEPISSIDEQKLVPPLAPPIFNGFDVASSSARLFVSSDQEISFTLPAGWVQVQPDVSAMTTDTTVQTIEIFKNGSSSRYPLGRITIQYTKGQGRLTPPESPFEPETEKINGIEYALVTGEENGGDFGNYSYIVYYGSTPDQQNFTRIFTRYQNEVEAKEQKDILSTFQVTP